MMLRCNTLVSQATATANRRKVSPQFAGETIDELRRKKYEIQRVKVQKLAAEIENLNETNPENGREITAIECLKLVEDVTRRGTKALNPDEDEFSHAFLEAKRVSDSALQEKNKSIFSILLSKVKTQPKENHTLFSYSSVYDSTDMLIVTRIQHALLDKGLFSVKMNAEGQNLLYISALGKDLLDYWKEKPSTLLGTMA